MERTKKAEFLSIESKQLILDIDKFTDKFYKKDSLFYFNGNTEELHVAAYYLMDSTRYLFEALYENEEYSFIIGDFIEHVYILDEESKKSEPQETWDDPNSQEIIKSFLVDLNNIKQIVRKVAIYKKLSPIELQGLNKN